MSTERDNLLDPTDAAVYCKGKCGLVFLTDEQYDAQMDLPNATWTCPQCGSSAEWDDDCRITNPPDDDI